MYLRKIDLIVLKKITNFVFKINGSLPCIDYNFNSKSCCFSLSFYTELSEKEIENLSLKYKIPTSKFYINWDGSIDVSLFFGNVHSLKIIKNFCKMLQNEEKDGLKIIDKPSF